MMKIKESVVTGPMVNPDLCKHLWVAGLYGETAYHWRIFKTPDQTTAIITTDKFDPDGYYKLGMGIIDQYRPASCLLPAYTISEIEKIVPGDYTIAFDAGKEYLLMPSTLYNELDGYKSDRLPDLFALYLLDCIEKRIIDPEKVNCVSDV